MFDPFVGRWMQDDPEGFAAGDMNLYRFVGNNPTNATDPSGLETAKKEPEHPWKDYTYKKDTTTIDYFFGGDMDHVNYEGYVTATIKKTDFSYWTNEGRGPHATEFKQTKFTITVKNDTWCPTLGKAHQIATDELAEVEKGKSRWVYIKPVGSIGIQESWDHPVHDGIKSEAAIWTFDITPNPSPFIPGQPTQPDPLEGEIAVLYDYGVVGPDFLIVGWKLKPVISLNDGTVTYEAYIRLQQAKTRVLPPDLLDYGDNLNYKLWHDTTDAYYKRFDMAPFARLLGKPAP